MATNLRQLSIEDLWDSAADSIIKQWDKHDIYFRQIDPSISLDTQIYRYIKIEYLFDLIDRGVLYIPNRKNFTDLRDKIGIEKRFESLVLQLESVPSHKCKKDAEELMAYKKFAFDICVSCWTLDSRRKSGCNESFLMWRAYQHNGDICRIGTTIGHLIDSIKSMPCDLAISDVSYNERNAFVCDRFIFNKSPYYDDEQELRIAALIHKVPFIEIPIDPYILIDEITLSPFLIPRIENIYKSMLEKTYPNLKDKIQKSHIMEYPVTNY